MVDNSFTFTRHALDEIKKRELDFNIIKACLENPEQIIQTSNERSVYQSIKNDSGKKYLIRVVIETKEMPNRVITAYKTSKISKYWSKKNEN